MDLDGYRLYEQLKHGDAVWIEYRGNSYKLLFVGQPIGSNNYLLVTQGDTSNRYGWGWGSEQVWQALRHLEQGWNREACPPYQPYIDELE